MTTNRPRSGGKKEGKRMTRQPKYPVQTVMKAIEIINLLAKEGGSQGLGISEFSKELEMGKSTVHRLLDTLQFYGYIEKDEDSSRYRLGWELYKIGQQIPQQNQLFNLNPNYLMELGRRTQETVNLGILKRSETVLLSKIEGSRDALRVSVNPGEYESIHATGIGKAVICEMSDDEVRALLNGKETLVAYTAHTITRTEDLLSELRTIRRQGYAVDAEEYCLGLYCIAMPIRDYTEKIIAAVSVSTPTVRMNDEKKRLILDALGKCAHDISRALGYPR